MISLFLGVTTLLISLIVIESLFPSHCHLQLTLKYSNRDQGILAVL